MHSWDEDGEVGNALARVMAWAIGFLALALAISVLAGDPGVFLALAGSLFVAAIAVLVAFVATTIVLFGLLFAARRLALLISSASSSARPGSALFRCASVRRPPRRDP